MVMHPMPPVPVHAKGQRTHILEEHVWEQVEVERVMDAQRVQAKHHLA